ncbi:MAG: HAD family hydrolase [Candidatus Helarchaeota archaeon]|nr:HAD family hydrolase [Candidatus Helarchaeota archaeon]
MAVTVNNKINLENIKAIVFDWDGTLFNNVPAIRAATQTVLERFNADYPGDVAINEFMDLMTEMNENNLPTILLNHYKILNRIPFFNDLSYLQKLQVLFMIYSKFKQYSEFSQLYTGTQELIKYLAQKFDLALLTSSKRDEITETLEKYGIVNYFKSILTTDEIKNPKPNPEGIMKTIQQLNYHPENVLYVGDSATDILTAKAARVPSIAISNGLISRQNLMEYEPNFVCDHVTDLAQFFDLPKISVDTKMDEELTIDYHAEKIKSYVKEDFNFFSLLQEVLPRELRFDAVQAGKIIQDPLGFIGAIIQDGITRYTRGEIELKNQFTVFSNTEEDLLKCLGLIIIHFVNERSNNIIKNLIENPVTKVPSALTATGLKLSYQYFYPNDYKIRFQNLFLKLFGKIIPTESLDKLQEMDTTTFANSVLDGCELALHDLGLSRVRNLDFKPIKPISNGLSSLILEGPSKLVQGIWRRVTDISQDILDKDFRKYPED